MDISWSLGGKAKAKAKALAASLLVAWLIIRIRLHGTSTKGKIAAQATGVAGYRPPPPGHGRQVLPQCARIAADRHGLIMKLRMGQKLTVVVSDVDIARECLTTHDRAFAARPKLAVGRILGFDYTSIVWPPTAHCGGTFARYAHLSCYQLVGLRHSAKSEMKRP
ncbi:hypothetical protein AMTR_s00029p00188590 [Amborella trichopoda]|uniref:Uncharacterized protein n=1 Tax=Amborella trichopoda TaxID=13333 RepID=W1PQW8_AMBTC|nr:hypothetical protein AMTR_s00029p00188590 [Amborella trichopoda]